ncbi:MAG: hypothetical protein JEZ06_05000 [Anaerolineaceae bacterium]|nr:hypothetical protein [Anaerolineaceae bacterium]
MDFSNFGDMLEGIQDAYSEGISAMAGMGDLIAEETDPTHKIEIDIQLKGNAEGHTYEVDAGLTFEIELDTVLQAGDTPIGDLGAVMEQMGLDLGDDAAAVIEQLSQPRLVGLVKNIDQRKLSISGTNGKIHTQLNRGATLLATVTEDKLSLNFEGVFTYPQFPDAFYIIPTTEKMQENICFDISKWNQPISYQWTDQDNLLVMGTAKITSL